MGVVSEIDGLMLTLGDGPRTRLTAAPAPLRQLKGQTQETARLCERVAALEPDQRGFGRSDPKSGRTLADWSDDVAVAADALGLGRLAVAGARLNLCRRERHFLVLDRWAEILAWLVA